MKTHPSSRTAKSVVRRAARTAFESLERRRMMSTTTLTGTAGADTWNISYVNAGDTVIIDGMGGADRVVFGLNNRTTFVNGHIVLKNANGGNFQDRRQ